jgi:hypothetical protein
VCAGFVRESINYQPIILAVFLRRRRGCSVGLPQEAETPAHDVFKVVEVVAEKEDTGRALHALQVRARWQRGRVCIMCPCICLRLRCGRMMAALRRARE